MSIDIQSSGFTLTPAIRNWTERRLRLALGSVGDYVLRSAIRLSDENGPRGGIDKRCTVRLTLPGQPAVVVAQQSDDLYLAIDLACDRAGRSPDRSQRGPPSGRDRSAVRAGRHRKLIFHL